MSDLLRASTILLFVWMALVANATYGQSLSIISDGGSGVLVEAAAPSETRFVLQQSSNLHLWVDINDAVSGRASNQLDCAGLTQSFFRLTPWAPPASPITVVLLGDSTVADFASNFDVFNGWGQGIYGFFKSNARVINLAMAGYSSKIFLASAEKTQMLTIKPDYVLVQFGLIDEFGTERQTTTLKEFGDNLKTIVLAIRSFNGTPILLTPPVRNLFGADGKIVPIYQNRFAVIKSVATELHTYLIDLNRLSMDLVNQLGQSASQYIWWPGNYLHYSDKGAQIISGLVVNALSDYFGTYLVGILDPLPKP